MNDMRRLLSEFLESSTPEQLRAELDKGHRPFFQTIADPVLSFGDQFLPVQAGFSLPASVSFFQGEFMDLVSTTSAITAFGHPTFSFMDTMNIPEAANQELALAA